MSLTFGAIADDLTGGLELAAMLTAGGVACDFVTEPEAAGNAEALVVGRRTRVADPVWARSEFERIGQWLVSRGARQIFFKYCATFDSTPAGNIGPCAEALMDVTGARFTAFCPSFPEVGRRVFQGHLFADDRLISESPKRFDPLTPMTDPDLVRVLQQQTRLQVGLIPQQIVRANKDAMEARCAELVERGIGFAIADAATPEDLAALAALTVNWPLMTGNSSVAAYYPKLWRELGLLEAAARPRPLPGISGPGVVLAGSCADRTRRQLEVFGKARPILTVDLAHVDDPSVACNAAMDWAKSHLGDGPVAIATSAGPEDVAALQARIGQRKAADLAENLLSQLAARLARLGVRRFLVAGGETSGAVLDSLGVTRLEVGAYRAPGIAHAVSATAEPIAFCLKSGKLGPEDMFLPMLAAMERGEG